MKLGELFAVISVDDSAVDKGVERAKRKIREVGDESERMSTRTNRAFRVAGHGASALFKGVSTGFAVGSAATGTFIASLGKVGLGYNKLQQNSRAALKTILGGTKEANEQMDKLDAFAKTSPFAKQVFITAQQQLLGFGVEAKKVLPILDAIQNAVAATGGSSQQVGELAFVLAQIQAAGKITGQDLMQLGQRGVNAAELIGESLGKTGAEVKGLISKGKIDATDAIDAITSGMTKKFGGATKSIKEQMDGALDRVAGAKRDIGANLAEPFVSKNGGGAAVQWTNQVADGLRKVEKLTGTAMKRVDASKGAFKTVSDGLNSVNKYLDKIDANKLIDQLGQFKKYTPIVTGLGTAFGILGLQGVPVIGALAGGLSPVVVGLGALAATSPKVRESFKGAAESAGELAPKLGDLAVKALDLATNVVEEAAPGVGDLAEAGIKLLDAGIPLVSMMADALNTGTPLIGVIGDIAGLVKDIPQPVMAMGLAFAVTQRATNGLGPKLQSAAESILLTGMYAKDSATKVGLMGTAMGVAKAGIKGVGTALKTAFISNPIGLAITAITTAIAFFISKQAEAKQSVDEMADTLDRQTGAITANTRALIAKKLEEDGMLETAKSLGVATEDVISAIMGQKEAVARVNETLEKTRHTTSLYSAGVGGSAEEVSVLSEKANELKTAIGEKTETLNDAIETTKRQTEATGTDTNALEANSEAIEENRRIQEGRTNALIGAINAARGFQDAQESLTKIIEDGGRATLGANGSLDLYSEGNRRVLEPLTRMSKAILDQAAAMDKQGESQATISAKWDENIGAFRKAAEQAGITGKTLDDLMAKLGLVKKYESVNIQLGANTKPAEKDIDDAIKVASGKTGKIKIDANNNPAIKQLLTTMGKVDESTGIATIDAENDKALARLLVTMGAINRETGVVTIDGNPYNAKQKVQEVKNYASSQTAVMRLYVDTSGVQQAVIRAKHSVSGISMTTQLANGGLVEYYARGGTRSENHVAQIAPAGTWRVWAEPETGGEAYIPLAPSKRRRSMEILHEVADRFGMIPVPKSGKRFADGGSNSASRSIDRGPRLPIPVIIQIDDKTALAAHIRGIATEQVLEGMMV